jgi:hypothetical protein
MTMPQKNALLGLGVRRRPSWSIRNRLRATACAVRCWTEADWTGIAQPTAVGLPSRASTDVAAPVEDGAPNDIPDHTRAGDRRARARVTLTIADMQSGQAKWRDGAALRCRRYQWRPSRAWTAPVASYQLDHNPPSHRTNSGSPSLGPGLLPQVLNGLPRWWRAGWRENVYVRSVFAQQMTQVP